MLHLWLYPLNTLTPHPSKTQDSRDRRHKTVPALEEGLLIILFPRINVTISSTVSPFESGTYDLVQSIIEICRMAGGVSEDGLGLWDAGWC